jgi:hypothetical protein
VWTEQRTIRLWAVVIVSKSRERRVGRRGRGKANISRLVIEVIAKDHPKVTVIVSIGSIQELNGVVEHIEFFAIETGDELTREARVTKKDTTDSITFLWNENFKSL